MLKCFVKRQIFYSFFQKQLFQVSFWSMFACMFDLLEFFNEKELFLLYFYSTSIHIKLLLENIIAIGLLQIRPICHSMYYISINILHWHSILCQISALQVQNATIHNQELHLSFKLTRLHPAKHALAKSHGEMVHLNCFHSMTTTMTMPCTDCGHTFATLLNIPTLVWLQNHVQNAWIAVWHGFQAQQQPSWHLPKLSFIVAKKNCCGSPWK